jgi:hypothetical protein
MAAAASDSAIAAQAVAVEEAGDIDSASSGRIAQVKPAGSDTRDKANSITFLCPNGHKLTCPLSMKGKTGQCPHCDTKFIIPEPRRNDDLSEFLELPDDELTSNGRSSSQSAAGDEAQATFGQSREADLPVDFAELVSRSGPQSIAGLFARIWGQRREGEIIELSLAGGERIVPDWFASHSVDEPYGMFALLASDGAYTLLAIRWDVVQQITVRGMVELPEGLFE